MAYRTLYITNPAHLLVKSGSLIVRNATSETPVPMEDVASIIIEHQQVTMTSPFLSQCAENDIALFFCNEQHLPTGISLPFQNHVRQHKRLEEQICMSLPFKNRLWQKIVQQKIQNQAAVLRITTKGDWQRLHNLAANVVSGDKKNLEGYAAKLYFTELFGSGFTRDSEVIHNAALNYGYAIVRGLVARALVGYGFTPSMGLHHCNEYNNFNLADDMIEAYRPVVDLLVASLQFSEASLSPDNKISLVGVLSLQVQFGDQRLSLLNAVEQTIKSLVTALTSGDVEALELPVLMELTEHIYG